MERSSVNSICLFFGFLFFNLSCGSADQPSVGGENKTANASFNAANEVSINVESTLEVNEKGWELPDLTKCRLAGSQVNLNIKSPKPVTQNLYFAKGELLLNTGYGPMRVRLVREFEIEKRKFCYIISVVPPIPKNSNVSYAPVQTNLVYYDLDGDGKFETKDSRYTDFPTILPKWLNDN